MASATRPQPPAGDDLAALYDQHAPRLYAVAHRLLGSAAEAEECVQDLFVALARARLEPAGDRLRIDDVRAYLFASVRHAAAQRARAQSGRERLRAVLERGDEPRADGPDALDSRALQQALRALPDEQREVVALKVDGQLTFAEIAAAMGTTLNTAASRYRYALAKLKSLLEETP